MPHAHSRNSVHVNSLILDHRLPFALGIILFVFLNSDSINFLVALKSSADSWYQVRPRMNWKIYRIWTHIWSKINLYYLPNLTGFWLWMISYIWRYYFNTFYKYLAFFSHFQLFQKYCIKNYAILILNNFFNHSLTKSIANDFFIVLAYSLFLIFNF